MSEMSSDPQSTVIIALAPGDTALIEKIRTLMADIGNPSWGFVVVDDSATGFDFKDIEWVRPAPREAILDFPELSEAEKLELRTQLDQLHGIRASMAYSYEQHQEDILLAAKELKATLPKQLVKIEEFKLLAQKEEKPARQGKKGRGFADPRNRIIT